MRVNLTEVESRRATALGNLGNVKGGESEEAFSIYPPR